jgi:hypothetical protein
MLQRIDVEENRMDQSTSQAITIANPCRSDPCMKAARDFRDFLFDILDHAKKGIRITEGIEYGTFQKDENKIVSGTYVIMIMGEAVKHLRQN